MVKVFREFNINRSSNSAESLIEFILEEKLKNKEFFAKGGCGKIHTTKMKPVLENEIKQLMLTNYFCKVEEVALAGENALHCLSYVSMSLLSIHTLPGNRSQNTRKSLPYRYAAPKLLEGKPITPVMDIYRFYNDNV
ncbi:23914_t:CDS:2 [Gigaspora margarita]|uniref:23914_t:CDS:1 n=1 Tax=Gigaspora margarita TaxID=4874 RepID=A0ABN7UXR3_GIGMA|nr:23914_t:CDS:2 [Gigaspora margarita]